ncbi:TonB-dependent receptor plug domain-containing protein [Caulobacter segnis]|uniref:TonB-dependent receptor plug domain-containing protein n=1 Tax=Caulobacter segnis TaxID=88688 RepID=UPI001CBF9C1F|nr:TonB-dependent receptor [Caulobacter segnis]UAL11479.1 TonB-dependent receptor [Caulobacter segnis]
MKKTTLFALAAFAPLALAASSALAATAANDAPIATADEPTLASEVVVQAKIAYRNRSESTAPVLEYGLDYFQRFEPLTVGDALKRVPSVSFLSDVLESDGVRLRGLDPAYTQILINGEKVPGSGSSSGAFGSGADQAFFVDRIPAELIDHIEIVRSNSANRSGDAVAGALNIVLRDALALDGGYVRAGALMFDDKRIRGAFGGVWGGQVGPGRLLIGANVQGRRNPKEKLSLRYDEPGASLNNNEIQTDTRNGTDSSFNIAYDVPVGPGQLSVNGFYVHTDRFQDEDSIEYNKGVAANANLSTINNNDVDIQQDSYSLNGKYKFPMAGGETSIKLGYAAFQNDEYEFEYETEYLRDTTPFPDGDRFTGDRAKTRITDDEVSAKLEHKREIAEGTDLEFGVQYEGKRRDARVSEVPRNRYNLPSASPPAYGPFAISSKARLEQTRLDPYVMLSGRSNGLKWEAGLRYETTDVKVQDFVINAKTDKDYNVLLPSASVRYDLTGADQIYASVARTVRRAGFEYLSPVTLEEELGDNDFRGDPTLEPEKAWGVDVGYERRMGRDGVFGINVFYRDIKDLIEIYNTGAPGSANDPPDDVTWLYSARNTGDGKVYGIEFDLSTPLSFIGWDNTGVFLNYSYLDSEVKDEFGKRRFNSQAESVFNVGFIQDIPSFGAAFGMTYRKQGEAYSRVVGEEVTTTYGADLEAFIEKRIGKNTVVRLTGSNLLDAKKEETFNKFTTIADQRGRSFDEYELEREKAGPVFQLTARMAF